MNQRYSVPQQFQKNSWIDQNQYKKLYAQSIEAPDQFWKEQSDALDWFQKPTKIKNTSFALDNFRIRWFEDGVLNVSYNCLDRHLKERGDKIAIIWEGDNPDESKIITYRELHQKVCLFASALKNLGVCKGDFVTIYMPMLIETAVAMLACTRIGAVHSVVFGGFSAESLADRIVDCGAKVVITADESFRSGRKFPYKERCDEALRRLDVTSVESVIVVKRGEGNVAWHQGRDHWFDDLLKPKNVTNAEPMPMSAEDPLFVLYTSGSTAKPKGLLHTTAGYLLYASMTHRYVFDYHENDIYWCTADVGWITGHSYVIYGPLANGGTTLMFEGVPNYPSPSRFWDIVDKHQVNIFYTAPTAIRSLMAFGDEYVQQSSRKSLRILGSVGEPLNHEAWEWYYHTVGEAKCPIMDTWWQTETGGILIAPLPGAIELKPASVTLPFFGIKPALVDHGGHILSSTAEGSLVMLDSWPGQARTILNDHQRFLDTYFKPYSGMYCSGDGAKRDDDGYFSITGRVDDVINVSGHRIGTAEVESALNQHPFVSESAVVGFPHDVKGQGIYAYVTLRHDYNPDDEIEREIKNTVRKVIGAIAVPDKIQWASKLPKTRSGKIMRRILRKIAANEHHNIGDTSTLAEPEVVDDLINNRYIAL